MPNISIIGILLTAFCLPVAFGVPQDWVGILPSSQGDVTLEEMGIERVDGRPVVRMGPTLLFVDRSGPPPMNLPQSPMPTNVKNFKTIGISYIDEAVLNFLRKFATNGLFTNVNLEIAEFLQQHLHQILPLLGNINSINFNNAKMLGTIYKENAVNNNAALAMLMKTRIMGICFNVGSTFDDEFRWYIRWLHTAQTPPNTGTGTGVPRLLILHPSYTADKCYRLFERIKQEASNSASFFIRLGAHPNDFEWRGDITWEAHGHKFTMKRANAETILIARYPSNADKKWVEANEKEVLDWTMFLGGKTKKITDLQYGLEPE